MRIYLTAVMILQLLCVKGQDLRNTEALSRSVRDNVLVSADLPEIKMKINDEFEFVGSFYFEIVANSEEYAEDVRGKTVAAGDRFVFVAADEKKKVEKLFIIQLEGFLPSLDFIYNYNFDNAEFIGENKYLNNTWFYDSSESAKQNPNGEGALTTKFLEEKGFRLENHVMMSRFVGLASEDRKNEIIIFYIEMLNSETGYTLDEYENSVSDKEKEAIRNSLIERSRNSFSITKG
ncbi:MAG: hypothetical protein ABJG78_07115 [Cyclobacteriaceae bacterium]